MMALFFARSATSFATSTCFCQVACQAIIAILHCVNQLKVICHLCQAFLRGQEAQRSYNEPLRLRFDAHINTASSLLTWTRDLGSGSSVDLFSLSQDELRHSYTQVFDLWVEPFTEPGMRIPYCWNPVC